MGNRNGMGRDEVQGEEGQKEIWQMNIKINKTNIKTHLDTGSNIYFHYVIWGQIGTCHGNPNNEIKLYCPENCI